MGGPFQQVERQLGALVLDRGIDHHRQRPMGESLGNSGPATAGEIHDAPDEFLEDSGRPLIRDEGGLSIGQCVEEGVGLGQFPLGRLEVGNIADGHNDVGEVQ